jgi:hypothetical protein
MTESEFPDAGTIVSDLTPTIQMQDAVEDNQNELTQPAGDYLMEVDNEPIASSSALQLENLPFASFISTGDASANHALDLL